MELSAGYKNTEVGVIPEDWEIKRFGELVNYTKGFAFKSKDYRKEGVRIIRVSDTTFDSIKKGNEIYIDKRRSAEFKKWRLEENDLIFSTVGSKPPMFDSLVGKVILVGRENSGNLLNQNAVKITAKLKTKEIQNLLLNHFRVSRYITYIEEIFRGNANQASITLKDLFNFKIPLPPTKTEQKAIANVLSDTDELLQAIEKKIAKKRLIKKGAMQELLKPKEGWDVKTLGEVLKVKHGKDQKEIEVPSGKYPILGTGGLMGFTNSFLCKKPSVLIGRKGTIDKPQYMDTPFWTVDTLFYTDVFEAFFPKYIFYVFKMIDWYSYNAASGVPSLNAKTIEKIEKQFPPKTKQIEIANILTSMDDEIENLEKKLEKYKQIKQGLMQNLLTGKIRLV